VGGGVKAGGVALRLVLLALLLFGVGVVHTLSHVGAHDGVSASDAVQHAHQADTAFDETVVAPDDPHMSVAAVDQEDTRHRAHAEGTTASECFALIPTGSWLVPPHCPSIWGDGAGVDVRGLGLVPDPGLGPTLSQLSVLRI
jgi:hypothetical protein